MENDVRLKEQELQTSSEIIARQRVMIDELNSEIKLKKVNLNVTNTPSKNSGINETIYDGSLDKKELEVLILEKTEALEEC